MLNSFTAYFQRALFLASFVVIGMILSACDPKVGAAGGDGVPYRLSLTNNAPKGQLLSFYSCIPLIVRALGFSKGKQKQLPVAENVSLTLMASQGAFYQDAGCTQALENPVLKSGKSDFLFYYQPGPKASLGLNLVTVTADLLEGGWVGISLVSGAILGSLDGDFHYVAPNAVVEQTLTLKNSGDAKAKNIAATLVDAKNNFTFAGGAYPGTDGTCATELEANSSCEVTIRLTAPATYDALAAALHLEWSEDNGVSRKLDINLKAQVASAIVQVTGDQVFSAMGMTPVTKVFTVTNTGNIKAYVDFYLLTNDGQFEITDSTCNIELAGGANCTFDVTYTPDAALTAAADLQVYWEDDAGNSDVLDFALSGSH